jgi:hypothetical protein
MFVVFVIIAFVAIVVVISELRRNKLATVSEKPGRFMSVWEKRKKQNTFTSCVWPQRKLNA